MGAGLLLSGICLHSSLFLFFFRTPKSRTLHTEGRTRHGVSGARREVIPIPDAHGATLGTWIRREGSLKNSRGPRCASISWAGKICICSVIPCVPTRPRGRSGGHFLVLDETNQWIQIPLDNRLVLVNGDETVPWSGVLGCMPRELILASAFVAFYVTCLGGSLPLSAMLTVLATRPDR